MSHTPGPWSVDNRGNNCLQILAESKGDGYFAGIASVVQRDAHPSKDVEITHAECRANAQLIAAAPKLLEALKNLVDFPGEREAMVAARAAIQKAEGAKP